MMDIKAGDLVVCVDAKPKSDSPYIVPTGLREGRVYRVIGMVWSNTDQEYGVELLGARASGHREWRPSGYDVRRFHLFTPCPSRFHSWCVVAGMVGLGLLCLLYCLVRFG